MDDNNEMSQPMSDEQRFRELQQRINAKAENLVKRGNTEVKKNRWIAIAGWAVFAAIIIAVEVDSYKNNNFWEVNAMVCIFVGSALIIYFILTKIMRSYLTRMKSSNAAPQYYRDVKRLITTHKLRQWLPLAVAFVCTSYVSYGSESWFLELLIISAMVLGSIWGASMRNWFLDDDFRFDVDELGEMTEQENAA